MKNHVQIIRYNLINTKNVLNYLCDNLQPYNQYIFVVIVIIIYDK